MIRVLHVTTGLELGGAERILVNCADKAVSEGFESKVVALKSGGMMRRALDDRGIQILELDASAKYPDPIALLRLVKECRSFQPHVIQAWMYHANLFAMAATILVPSLSKNRLVWGIYNSKLKLDHYGPRMGLVVKAGALASLYPTAIVYNSHRARSEHKHMGYRSRENLIIANGIDTGLFRPDPQRRAATRASLGLADDAFVAVVVARVDPQKDWATVLAGISKLEGMVTLAVGPTTDKLPNQKGLLKIGAQLAMENIYPAADVFILPSAFGEGTSVAMTEAMACGIPVIVTDVGDNGIYGSEGGQLIPSGSPMALAEALVAMRDNTKRRAELGARGRACIEREHEQHSFQSLFRHWRLIASSAK